MTAFFKKFTVAVMILIAFSASACKDPPPPNEPPGPPRLTGTVSIDGPAGVGHTLTANTSSLNGTGEISYQWLQGEEEINGADSDSFYLRIADEGKTFSVRVKRAGYTGEVTGGPTAVIIRSVSSITNVQSLATAGIPQLLSGTVLPSSAPNKTITWSVLDPGATGASINDNVLNTTASGTVTVTATITNGTAQGADYTQDFPITVAEALPFDQWVTRVSFTSQRVTIDLNNLNNHDIYLVKVNTSDSVVAAASTGLVLNVDPELTETNFNARQFYGVPKEPRIMGRPFDEEPLPAPPPDGKTLSIRQVSDYIQPEVGAVRNFWIETVVNNRNFVSKQAVLYATGNHGNIWVVDDSITTEDAEKLAAKFDIIYPAATNIFGYEYGGKPGHAEPGGKDGDRKIQILIYNIGNNYAGFFWSKDFYPDGTQINLKSNQAEIFYIDADMVKDDPLYAYDTLTHELQHMIHFNEKIQERKHLFSSVWYNEMMSMMSQDIISHLIDIPTSHKDHVTQVSLPSFLANYAAEGFTEWGIPVPARISYSTKYAFGAYMIRSYGGAEFVKKLSANNFVDVPSISAALGEMEPRLTFNEALIRFAEVMINNNPSYNNIRTFNKTVSNTINGITYTAAAFDIWDIKRAGSSQTGPAAANLNQREMRPHTVCVHSADAWKNKSGSYSVTLQRPANSGIVFVLVVKEN